MTTQSPTQEPDMADAFDYVVVGGGSAGAAVAARLSEDPNVSVCVLEWGPTDVGFDDVLQIRRWLDLLEGPIDLAYTTTLQPRGNAHIVHSRAKVLGGCSSHNTMIWFKPFPGDWQDWVDVGCAGWEPDGMEQYYQRIPGPHQIVGEKDRNAILYDWIEACGSALGVDQNTDWNAGPFPNGAGFLDVGYNDATGVRSSSSVMYLHPIMGKRANLEVRTNTRAHRIEFSGKRATAVHTQHDDGSTDRVEAKREIIVACGSVDTPRLLMYSGVGPRKQLEHFGIDVVEDLPGVGENLIDHPESIIIWKLKKPMGPEGAMDADCALFVNRLGGDDRPDLMYHTYQLPFTFNTERLGYEVPDDRWCICMTPNIPRSHSTGRLYLLSKDPNIKPALDFRYFTDEDGYDEQTIVDGLKIARQVAAEGPFADWIEREIAPGPDVTSDAALSEYGRAVHHTVYHPSGTCKMGDAGDDTAVVDPELRVRGLEGISIADGSIFPSMPTVNPVVATFMIGEKSAELVRARN
jgi:choline dehydrogenase-like flavoprotein